jgi:hypothetical protein
MQPNAQFSTLINRGLKYENAGYLLKDAVKLANNYLVENTEMFKF